MKGWRNAVALAALALGLGTTRPAHAGFLEDAGWGSLTVLSNLVYMPVKMVYAGLGGITGGLAFALTGGDVDTAEKVWVPSMGGTYIVTPSMLRGEESIAFSGSASEASAESTDGGGSPPELDEQQLGGDR